MKFGMLDMGCGMDAKGDVNIDVQKVYLKYKGKPKNFILASAVYLPFKNDAFKIARANHLIEHFSDNEVIKCLKEIRRVAGSAIITVPNVYWLPGSWKYGWTSIESENRKNMLLFPHKQIFDTVMLRNTLKLVFEKVTIIGKGTWISIWPLDKILTLLSRKITFISRELVAICESH
jgi:predicted SAM-dependent methyltransferase